MSELGEGQGTSGQKNSTPGMVYGSPIKAQVLQPVYLGLHHRHKTDQLSNPQPSLTLFVLILMLGKIKGRRRRG